MWRKITFRTGLWIFSIVCVLALIPITVSEYYQTGQFPYETAAAIFSSALVPNLIRFFVKTGRRPNEDRIVEDFKRYSGDFGDSRAEIKAKNLFYAGFEEWYSNEITAACYDMERAIAATENKKAQAKIYCCLGKCRYNKKKLRGKAFEAVQKSLQLDPGLDVAWQEMVRQLIDRGDREQARTTCDRGIQINPRSWRLLAQRAVFSIEDQKYERALQDCIIAERQQPQNPTLAMNTAIAYAGIGNAGEAWSHCQHATELGYEHPENARARIETLLRERAAYEVTQPV